MNNIPTTLLDRYVGIDYVVGEIMAPKGAHSPNPQNV